MTEEKKKQLTVTLMKEKRTVPDEVKEKSKKFVRMRKAIKASLKEGPKTIPQMVEEMNFPTDVMTYYVMSLQKFGDITVGDLDEDDEYYFYKLPKK
ncbi:MAG: hypothetical protein IMY71_15745 [Bacteroidetes bacterium]|nr:hypothetical protein [Bacteroidota bacterium]